jgi:formate dehydrogenase subunit delta
MANQIGKFFVSEDKETAVAAIADHITKFWDPRMRAEILVHLAAGGEGLDPEVRTAVAALQSADKKP